MDDKHTTHYRATGVIARDGKILVIRRIRQEEEFYILPGGWPEPGETPEQATVREVNEECGIEATSDRYLFTIDNFDRPHHFYLITDFAGIVKLGGEEKQIMNEQNQYHLEWKDKEELNALSPLYPKGLKDKLIALFD